MSRSDFYQSLGVSRNAGPDEIRKAFRTLAAKLHPDRNPGDTACEARFKEIVEAYEVLSDPEKRALYDRYGADAVRGAGGGGGGASGPPDIQDVFQNLFAQMFGGIPGFGEGFGDNRGGRHRVEPLPLSLVEAAFGCEKTVHVATMVSCEPCGGSGAESHSGVANCKRCRGSGQLRTQQGMFSILRTCPACHGRGQVVEHPCATCGGEGRVRKTREVPVRVPPGVGDETRIRIAGAGEAGLRGPPGDLYLVVQIDEHPHFHLIDGELHVKIPVSAVRAALGGRIRVPTLDEERDALRKSSDIKNGSDDSPVSDAATAKPLHIELEPGTQPGTRHRLRGYGMPHARGGRGDLIVHIDVRVPTSLSSKQRELLEQFVEEAERSGDGCDGALRESDDSGGGFWDKVKEIFG